MLELDLLTLSIANLNKMFSITTPFFVALQYFGADHAIFPSLDRTPRNFFISLCVLWLALPALTWISSTLQNRLGSWISERKQRADNASQG
jgi:hypothetical protein